MYLSRLTLDDSRRSVLWRQQRYRVHQRLMMGCGDDTRMLYRLHETRPAILLVQTVSEPNWVAAFGEFPVLQRPPEVKSFEPCFHDGEWLAFRVLANPTVKRDGKRLGLYKADEQLEWLKRKAEIGGFAVASVTVQPAGNLTTWKNTEDTDKAMQMHFCAAQYDGSLQVRDAQTFAETFRSGLGSAKGFGFGLLSLARMPASSEV